MPNHEKKLLQTTLTKKQEKVNTILTLQKNINPKKNSFQPTGNPDYCKTIGKSR